MEKVWNSDPHAIDTFGGPHSPLFRSFTEFNKIIDHSHTSLDFEEVERSVERSVADPPPLSLEACATEDAPAIVHEAVDFLQTLQSRLVYLRGQINSFETASMKFKSEKNIFAKSNLNYADHTKVIDNFTKLRTFALSHFIDIFVLELYFRDLVNEGSERGPGTLSECLEEVKRDYDKTIRKYDRKHWKLLNILNPEATEKTVEEILSLSREAISRLNERSGERQ